MRQGCLYTRVIWELLLGHSFGAVLRAHNVLRGVRMVDVLTARALTPQRECGPCPVAISRFVIVLGIVHLPRCCPTQMAGLPCAIVSRAAELAARLKDAGGNQQQQQQEDEAAHGDAGNGGGSVGRCMAGSAGGGSVSGTQAALLGLARRVAAAARAARGRVAGGEGEGGAGAAGGGGERDKEGGAGEGLAEGMAGVRQLAELQYEVMQRDEMQVV